MSNTRRIDLENNSERFVAGKNDKIEAREMARYQFAKKRLAFEETLAIKHTPYKILDIGCSSGYGSRILTENFDRDVDYTGVDYDQTIIDYASSEFPKHSFFQFDITTPDFEEFLRLGKFDAIIAFEVLEHVENGRELAQLFKQYCDVLICSTPYNETPGFWGPHHKLHKLTANDFYGFKHSYMDWNGGISDVPTKDSVVMLMNWETPFIFPQHSCKKYSIIIPTYNHLNDCLIPCLDSVLANSGDLSQIEIIIVANGCIDDTIQYLKLHPFYDTTIFLLEEKEALGYTRAANYGIGYALGEYIVLLNNDTVIQKSSPNWLEVMTQPFLDDEKCGETGCKRSANHVPGLEDFIIGFCSMISRKVLNEVGLMDELFSPGGMDDVDLSMRIQRAGYTIHQAPVPIFHPGRSSTMHDLGNWQEIFDLNIEKLRLKYKKTDHVLAEICTKNRYHSTLPNSVLAVINQTRLPDKLIIYDDSDEKQDLREHPLWKYIFAMISHKGIDWEWVYTSGNGQHHSHEDANRRAENFVWRIDDDTVPEPNVLENLLKYMDDLTVGAVGGKILTPPSARYNRMASAKIADIYQAPNVQWFDNDEVIEAEHLHCSFLYRAGIAHYDLRLSPVAHREETLFSHEIFRAGYKVLIVPDAVTWHLRNPEGGIRAHTNGEFWAHDERIFSAKMNEWGVVPRDKHIIYCNLGLGDHYILLHALPNIVAKHGAENIVIVCYHPEVFAETGIQCITDSEARSVQVPETVENVYGYGWKTNWKDSLAMAFERQNT